GYADEDVAVEMLDLFRFLAQHGDVIAERLHLVQSHAPADAPFDGGGFVVREVDVVRGPQQREDLQEILFVEVLAVVPAIDVRVAGNAYDFGGDRGGRQHEVDRACGDGAARHSIKPGRLILGEGDASLGLHCFRAERSVGGRSGEDDADGAASRVRGQREI